MAQILNHKNLRIRIDYNMRVYRYQYQKKNRMAGLLFAVITVASVCFVLQGKRGQAAELKRELKVALYEEILQIYMPGISYRQTRVGEQTMADHVLSHFFLIDEGSLEVGDYPTQVESALSYEIILAREASDENYVDEKTGEVVITGSVPDIEGLFGETGTGLPDAAQGGTLGTGQPVVSYSREKLNDFDYLLQNFYQVDSTTTIASDQLNVDALLGKDMRLSHDASTPQILIYHTHSQEGYADSVPGDPSTSVMGLGDYLTQILTEQYGFNVIHHRGEYDVGDRDHAYSRAAPALEQILAENPGIEVVIDLHRDGVREDTRLVTNINGTEMAQIMFFNGLSRTTSTGDIDYLYNPYLADNLAMSFQMQLTAAEYYPGLTRRIYLKGYRYNMHYCPKTLLIEVGAQTNTVQEAMNAMVPLADILNKVLTGAQ